jgi:hypothetical protein
MKRCAPLGTKLGSLVPNQFPNSPFVLNGGSVKARDSENGWVAEWFKAPVLKTGVRASAPWVRIPPHPPYHCLPMCGLGMAPRLSAFFVIACPPVCAHVEGPVMGRMMGLVCG